MEYTVSVVRKGHLVVINCYNCFVSKLIKQIICNLFSSIGVEPKILEDQEPEIIESFPVRMQGLENKLKKEALEQKYKDERYSIEYCVWRDAIYDKSNRTCEDCGKKPKKIHAHHILGWSDNPDKRYSVDNGKCLCIPCHIKYHPWMKKEFKENE
jgi:hypothetical protein